MSLLATIRRAAADYDRAEGPRRAVRDTLTLAAWVPAIFAIAVLGAAVFGELTQ